VGLIEYYSTSITLVRNVDAGVLLRELESVGDDKKQAMYRSCREKGPISYPLKVSQPELASPSLLDHVQNRPDVEGNIRLLRKQRTSERGNAVYIQPQAKSSSQAADTTRFLLMEKVKKFLDSDQKVFLLMGDSGTGKSTFNKELEFELWQSYTSKTGRIPLHINLPAIDKPEQDMIAKQLRRTEFTELQIREMKRHRKFILICDGYDESQQLHNLYLSNQLNLPGEWDARMVISCRTEYLGADYRDRFQPGDRNQKSDSSLFQEAVLTPFSFDQMEAYIQQYVTLHKPTWKVGDYKRVLESIPGLRDLVGNPFLMNLSLDVLPHIIDPEDRQSASRVTRVELYDHFVKQWLERGKKRMGEKDLSSQAREAFKTLGDDGFTRHGVDYLKKLAVAIYRHQGGHPIVEYSRFTDEGSWKDEFFGRGYEKELLREACPLTKNGNQHRFVHRSLLEYGLALAVFDPQGKQAKVAPERTMRRRGSESSDELSFEFEDKDEYVDQDEDDWDEQFVSLGQEPDANSPLFWRNFVKDHSLLQFLKERVRKEPLFKEQLLAYIEHSKEDKKWRTAAANAITILVRAGEQFIGTDLQGIQIPGADLSHGVFDSVKLQNADLRKVTLHGIWLRQTDLSGAQMVGVQFGEFPFLADWRMVRSFAYSPDGKSIAVGFANGSIGVYSTSELVETQTLEGHIGAVQHAVYSPTGNKIASAGKDKTVRLWDMETGSQLHALKGHKLPVLGVAYSPQRDLVASASCDKTVRLWDVNTGECCKVLSGHTKEVFSVAYSPTRNQVASCSGDRTIRLWNVETGACSHTLSGHTSIVFGVAYSRDGDQIASGSMDKAVRVWDAGTGTSLHILNGHTGAVSSVAYSPNGDRVASGSADVTVRIWDVGTESCRHILTGHQDSIYVVSYSPSGDQVASVSTDKTLRLWDASTGRARLVCSGHSAAIQSIECSPKGDLIVSGSGDNTIRLWDAETGACRQTLDGKIDAIFSVAFSKHGDLIVSGGGDNLVRLWEVKSGKCQRVMTGHTNWVNSVAFSPEGTMVASTGGDMTVRLWNVATGDCSKVLDGHTDDVLSVAYAPDSKHIVTGSKDSKIRLWDISTGKPCKVLDGHTKWVMKVVYSPQGDQLASASTDMTVRLWDVRTRKCQLTLNGHTKEVQGVAYSVNGKLVASGSTDRTVRVWDVSSGECRAKVENFPDSVYCVSWCASSDIQYLVTGCKDGSVLKWQVSEGKEQSRVQLRWSASKGALTVTGAVIKGASGLTMLDKKLLEQHGATGEPDDLYVHERDGMVLIENDM
jgi:WD40 repeat protein